MIDYDDAYIALFELLDSESIEKWGSFASHVARWHLDLFGESAVTRIESARAAKAQGIPLWKWANDNPID